MICNFYYVLEDKIKWNFVKSRKTFLQSHLSSTGKVCSCEVSITNRNKTATFNY